MQCCGEGVDEMGPVAVAACVGPSIDALVYAASEKRRCLLRREVA
jgi:hypothetical protein